MIFIRLQVYFFILHCNYVGEGTGYGITELNSLLYAAPYVATEWMGVMKEESQQKQSATLKNETLKKGGGN